MEQIVKDFLDYVSYDTQSQDESDEFPSTAKQKVLAEHLAEQLRGMGLNGRMDDYGYVYAELPANCEGAPAVGFIAHMDTATELSGANVGAETTAWRPLPPRPIAFSSAAWKLPSSIAETPHLAAASVSSARRASMVDFCTSVGVTMPSPSSRAPPRR